MKVLLENRPTTVVIDCQSGWIGNTTLFPKMPHIIGKYFQQVGGIIDARAKKGHQTVLVEYDGYGDTVSTISQVARQHGPLHIVKKNSDDILNEWSALTELNKQVFAPLKADGQPIEIIGLNATACVLQSLIGFIRNGFVATVLARGTINHVTHTASEEIYRRYNEVNSIIDAYYDMECPSDTLDLSELKWYSNLVDAHLAYESPRPQETNKSFLETLQNSWPIASLR